MTYATYINKLRVQVGDTPRRIHVDWTGDGTTTAFQMPLETFPVHDLAASTYTVKKAGVLQTETTHYTLDKETGLVTFVAAPGSGQAVAFDGYAVYMLDSTWLSMINDSIYSLGDDFFKEFVDTAHTTTANMLSLSLVALQPNAIAVYEFQHRTGTSEDWSVVENFTNWRYDRDNNIIYIGDRTAFTVTGQPLRIRGLKTYTLGDESTDTIDVQDRYMTIIEYGTIARYWRYRYKSVVELVSKMTLEQSRTPLQELIMLSDRFDRMYEIEKAKLKPMKPARHIPRILEGGSRP